MSEERFSQRRRRLLRAVGGATVVGATAGCNMLAQSGDNQFEQEVHEKIETVAQQKANFLRNWNGGNLRTARTYARQPTVQGDAPATINQYFIAERRGNAWGSGTDSPHLYLVDKNSGDVLATTNAMTNNVTDIEESLLEPVRNAGPGVQRISAYSATGNDGQVEIAYVTNVDREDGRDLVLIHTVPVADVSGSLNGGGVFADADAQGVTMVVDYSDRIIFEQYNHADQYLETYPNKDVLSNARVLGDSTPGSDVAGPTGGPLDKHDESYQLGDREYVVGYSNVPPVAGTGGDGGAGGGDNPDWTVLLHINTDDAYGRS